MLSKFRIFLSFSVFSLIQIVSFPVSDDLLNYLKIWYSIYIHFYKLKFYDPCLYMYSEDLNSNIRVMRTYPVFIGSVYFKVFTSLVAKRPKLKLWPPSQPQPQLKPLITPNLTPNYPHTWWINYLLTTTTIIKIFIYIQNIFINLSIVK